MALFSRNSKQSTNAVNKPLATAVTLSPFNLGARRFADAYVLILLSKIFRGLRNVRFTIDEEVTRGGRELQPLADFLNSALQELVWVCWQKGAMVINKDVQDKWHTVNPQQWKWLNGQITNFRYVTYSDAYRFIGRPDLEVLRDHIDRLDRLVNADDYLTQALGAFGILSGKSMGLTPDDKKAFLDGIKRDIGITSDKYQFICMGSEIDFKQVQLPIKDLELPDKVKQEVMAIAGYFGIPYDLVPLSGKSTYDNQAAAIVDFYRNCISPIAEQVLELGRYAIKCDEGIVVPSRALTFTLDNIPELEADRDDTEKRLERAQKATEILDKVKGVEGADVSWLLDIINNRL